MASPKFGAFKVDRSGVSAIFRSQAMQSAVLDAAQGASARAGAAAAANEAALPTKWRKAIERYDRGSAPYAADSKVLTHTAVGVVRTSSLLGLVDENQNHTLEGEL